MHHHTELTFVDEFRLVSPLHFLKKRMKTLISFGAFCKGAAIFTLLLRRRVAFLHRIATCGPLFKP
jgi:hypothetical protein